MTPLGRHYKHRRKSIKHNLFHVNIISYSIVVIILLLMVFGEDL